MRFAISLPWWALVLLLAAAALLAWRTYAGLAVLSPRGRQVLTGLRFLTLLLLVLFLMRPVIIDPADGRRDALVAILVDMSRSMALADHQGRARIEAARRAVDMVRPGLEERFAVEVLGFGDRLRPVEPGAIAAADRRSDLTGALQEVAERSGGRRLAGVVVISDGGDTGREEAVPHQAAGAPVFALGVGAPRVARDREILSVTAGEAVVAGSRLDLSVTAVSHGFAAAPVELRVLENGRPVQVRRAVPPGDGSPFREVFQVSPDETAPTVYTVEIPPDPSELTPDNNARSVLVPPPGRPRRVLMVEGAPGFEHSFLRRAWAQDAGLEVDWVSRKGQNERGQDTFYVRAAGARAAGLAGGYPTTREALFAYDAIVLANIEADFFTRAQLETTAAFVSERAGGLLVLGGRSFAQRGLARTPLEDVLPLDLTDRGGAPVRTSGPAGEPNRLALTPEGEHHPVMQIGASADDTRRRWQAAPPLAAAARLGGPRPGAAVLAVTAAVGGALRPLVAVQRYGEGRAMIFGGEASWRWKMLLPSEDRTFELFWRQAARWLSASSPEPIAIAAPPAVMPGEAVALDVLARDAAFRPARDAAIRLHVTDPDGASRELRPGLADAAAGRYRVEFRPDRPGVHRLRAEVRRGAADAGTADAWLLVGGADAELAEPRLNDRLLRRLALASGGRYLDESDLPRLGDLLAPRVPAPVPPAPRDLWHNGWAFLAIVLLLGAEWSLRRQWGLR